MGRGEGALRSLFDKGTDLSLEGASLMTSSLAPKPLAQHTVTLGLGFNK